MAHIAAACRIGLYQVKGPCPLGRRSVRSLPGRYTTRAQELEVCWLSPRLLTKLLTNRLDMERSSRYTGRTLATLGAAAKRGRILADTEAVIASITVTDG